MCQLFDRHSKPIASPQDSAKFSDSGELKIDFSLLSEEVDCVLVLLNLDGNLVGGESVKCDISVDFKDTRSSFDVSINAYSSYPHSLIL